MEQATPTSQLAGQAGLTAPPTTPAGVGALGGTAQQQAMAGSVAQKTSALRQSLDSQTTLGEAEADKRYRSAASAEEQKKLDQQKRLGEVFGGTQQKVQDLIGAEMNKQAGPSVRLETAGAVTTTDPAKQAEVDATFSQIVSGVDTQANIVKLMGLTGQTQEQIAAAAQDAAAKQLQSGAGKAAAGAVADSSKVNVSALLPNLGTTREELATLLGLDPTAIDTMSLADLDEAVKATATQGAALSVAETGAASQNANLGAAERASLREASIEQSTTGQAASEAQLLDLGHALESAEVVRFGGKEYTVEQLLSDDNISKLVSDYLTNPDSETSKQLAADPNAAGLLGFVNKYKQALTDAATSVGKATAESSRIQSENKALAQVGDLSIPDSVMKALYGDKWGTPQAAQLAPTGIAQALKNMATKDLAAIKPQLTEMFAAAQADPSLAADIKNLSASGIKGLFTPRGTAGKTPWQDLQDTKVRKQEVEAAKGNIDALLGLYFGVPADQAKATFERARNSKPLPAALEAIGVKAGGAWPGGWAGGADTIYNMVTKSLSARDTPSEIANSKNPFTGKSPGNSVGWTPRTVPTAEQQAAIDKKAADTARLKQEAVTKKAAITKYVNEYKPALTAARKAEIIKNEMSWYVANGYA